MRLSRLKIDALPGIEPGFTFEPADGHVNIVTGPNAIGKSSLSRALKYLLGGVDRGHDPPNLHLEAEFLSGGVPWTVRRIGGQVAWMRDGENGPQAPLCREPASSASIDCQWRACWLRMRAIGNWPIRCGAPCVEVSISTRPGSASARVFAGTEERKLHRKQRALREVEREHSDLRGEEERLPDLVRGIAQAGQAQSRLDSLQTALHLHDAIRTCRTCADVLNGFPSHMEKLHGDELDLLIEHERKAADLGDHRKDAQRDLAAMVQELENTGLRDTGPEPEEVERIARLLQRTDGKSIERKHAKDELVQAEASLSEAHAALEGYGETAKARCRQPSARSENHGTACRFAIPPRRIATPIGDGRRSSRRIGGRAATRWREWVAPRGWRRRAAAGRKTAIPTQGVAAESSGPLWLWPGSLRWRAF